MSTPSNWPLSPSSVRFLVPKAILSEISNIQISQNLMPTAFGYYEHAQGHQISRQTHDDNLLLFCVDGKGLLTTDNANYDVHAGDCLLLPKNLKHSYKANIQSPWTIYWAHFDGTLIDEYLQLLNVSEENLRYRVNNIVDYENLFRTLLSMRHLSYQPNAFINASCIVQRLLVELSVQYPKRGRNKTLSDFEQIDFYFQENIARTLTLDDMAMAFGLSKFYFAKKFQKIIGVSPVRYFSEKKVQYACKLLDSGDQSIKGIAKRLGYEDAYYFSRLFKNIMGLSPQQYRNSGHGR